MKNAVPTCLPVRNHRSAGLPAQAGFSLLEMLVSVAIITIIMGAVFTFMYQAQKRFQGNAVTSESNQSARAALEVLAQEIGQAGYNPNWFNPYTPTSTQKYRVFQDQITGNQKPQCITMYDTDGATQDISGINPGDWLNVDTGAANELVGVLATTNTPVPTGSALTCTTSPYPYPCPCPLGSAGSASPPGCGPGKPNPCQIKTIFQMDHLQPCPPNVSPSCGNTTVPWPASSYKFAYPTGIVNIGTGSTFNGMSSSPSVSNPTTSNDNTLEIYGDINQDGVIRYNVYSLYPTTTPPTVLTLNTAACPGSYTLYNLYRSSTPVNFPASVALDTNNTASPLVQNVLYSSTFTAGKLVPPGNGPTCMPLFAGLAPDTQVPARWPSPFEVGLVPNQVSIIGTLIITISVAVNPQRLEAGIIEWYTMATQLRPLNLTAAVAVNEIGGYKFLPKAPLDLPMSYPAGYYSQ